MALSSLELLPPELLTPIFVFSHYNTSLLVASPLLAIKLSTQSTYRATCTYHLAVPHPAQVPNSAAQTLLFASKFLTWSFFQSWILTTFAPAGCLCGRTPDQGCPDPQWPPDFDDATRMMFSRSHLPRLAFARGRIPAKLLRGPWSEDKVRFLRFVVWVTGMSVDWADAGAREAAVEGRRQAIREGKLDAVELFNHNRRLGRVADLEILRFAVLEAGCVVEIVYDTLFTARMWGSKHATWECGELDRWCKERIYEGDVRGEWLKGRLLEMRGPDMTVTTGVAVLQKGVRTANPVWRRPVTQLGWYYQLSAQYPRIGLHHTNRLEQGDFWRWSRGHRKVIRAHVLSSTVPMDIWIPQRGVSYYSEISSSDSEEDGNSSNSEENEA